MAQSKPLTNNKPSRDAINHYTKSIQKCAYIISEYPNSKWVDDALFLMGKCFYYRANAYSQAVESFQQLIEKFPDSEFAAQSSIYLAKSYYQTKSYDKAKKHLTDFILNKKYEKYHAQALLLFADYLLEEKNFFDAERKLKQIIDNYPDSEEFEEAFLLLGKTYQESKEFDKSNEILNRLLASRVSKAIKLQGRYLIAKNFLELKRFEDTIEVAEDLIHKQYSESDRALSKLLLARSYVGIEQYEKAEDLFLLIVHENPSSDISAEAYFYLAEMNFKDLKDYQAAIENYNKVRQEKKTSPFVSTALTKSAIASQIVQYRSAGKDINVLDLAEQQFKLAEYYVFELEFPDSALVIYDEVIANQLVLQNSIDSLYTNTNRLKSELIQQYPYFDEKKDTLQFVIKKVQKDTLISDSTRTEVIQRLQNFQTQQAQYEIMLRNMNDFSEEVAPFAYFSKIYIYQKVKNDSIKTFETLSSLKNNFPQNKYTYAAQQFLDGEKVEFTTPSRMRQIENYHEAVKSIEKEPTESISQLKTIIKDKKHPYFQESLYLLGFVYYFHLADSISAKTYIDSLIQVQDYKEPLIRKVASFYDGNSFKEVSTLNSLEKYKEKEPEEDEEDKSEPMKEEDATENKK